MKRILCFIKGHEWGVPFYSLYQDYKIANRVCLRCGKYTLESASISSTKISYYKYRSKLFLKDCLLWALEIFDRIREYFEKSTIKAIWEERISSSKAPRFTTIDVVLTVICIFMIYLTFVIGYDFLKHIIKLVSF
jgi:hypothetical protein